MANQINKAFRKYSSILVSFLQVVILFLLRKMWLRTVFQTVASYFLLCLAGISIMLWFRRKKSGWPRQIWDSYLVLWSGIHAVIVLGLMSYNTFYLTWTQVTLVQLVNLFLGCALYWILFILFRRPDRAIGAGNILIGMIGTVNFYLVRFRGAPFRLADIGSLRTAGNVARNYDYTPNLFLIVSIADLVVWYWIWRMFYIDVEGEREKRKWLNPLSGLVTVAVAAGLIALPIMEYDRIYSNTFQFSEDNTYLAGLLAQMIGSGEGLPENYSVEEVRMAIDSFALPDIVDGGMQTAQKPNIVVIMNEAFSDLRVLGDFETDVPVLEYWDSLQENTIRGWANVSVLGGNTANSEYEFLASDSMGAYAGKVPYTSYFESQNLYSGLVSVLKEQGYRTAAFHPYLSSGWNRMQVYRSMQFDDIIFLDNLEEDLDLMRLYVSDAGDYSYIREWFEAKEDGVPQFFFNVTMQNHGGYTYDGENFEASVRLAGNLSGLFPDAEQYLSLVKMSDEALKELLTYFLGYDEPVIVVMFGDHQPRLEESFYTSLTGLPSGSWSLEQRMDQYKTPFIIWHNYQTEGKDIGNISLNYLAPILLDDAGLEMSPYQRYVLAQYEDFPVVTSLGIVEQDGTCSGKGSSRFEEKVMEYRLLIYNHTVDTDERVEEFFCIE